MTQPDAPCTPAQRALAAALRNTPTVQQLLRVERPVIAIAGESGSGKSITADCLAHELTSTGTPTLVLHQDDYFHRPPATNHAHRLRDLGSVGPQEVDLARLRAHVDAFRSGADDIETPVVEYHADRFITRIRHLAPFALLIVEGTYVLEHVHADARIFLDATSIDTRERRRERNRDIDAPIVEQVLAIEHGLIAPQVALADIIIDRDFAIVRTLVPGS